MLSSDSLLKKIIPGGIWVFSLRMTNRGMGLIRTLILANLLTPVDFGLIGVAMLAISSMEMLSETGFQTALIQKKGNIGRFLDTAWTVAALRSIILFGILFFSSPVIAEFFNSPDASPIIRVIAVSSLLSGFGNIAIIYFQRELEFKKQFIFEITASLSDLIISIYIAYLLQSAWAIVWGGLAGNSVRFILSYMIYPYRPRISIGKEEFMELFSFGKWVFGSSFIVYLVTQGDSLFTGKMLGIAALGLYQMAFIISNIPTIELAQIVSQVTFPTYARLQDDRDRIKQLFLNALKFNIVLVMPVAAGIVCFTQDFIRIFLSEKWLPMSGAMQVLAIAGFIRSLSIESAVLLLALNRPDLNAKLQFLRFAILALSIYPLSANLGILGTAFSVLLSISLPTAGFLSAAFSAVNISIRDFFRTIFYPLAGAGIMVASIQVFQATAQIANIWHFLLSVAISGVIYLFTIYVLDRFFHLGIYQLIRTSISPP